jgi:hypothetical protein
LSRFRHFAAVDWSGAKGPRQKGIAVATCELGNEAPSLVAPEQRWSRLDVLDWLIHDMPPDTLVGFDLSPGLPFVDCGSYFPEWDASPPNAKGLWSLVDSISKADPHFSVTSFVKHPDARRHFRHGKGDCGDLFQQSTGRLRETESEQAKQDLSPTSCFNLVGASQVGKSSLTGMRIFNALEERLPIWPFDSCPTQGSVLVEIYTSLAARCAGIPKGKSKMLDGASLDRALQELGVSPHAPLPRYTDHATDAILTAAWLRKIAHDPALWNPPGLDDVRHTEGWTFGVR